MKPKLIEIWGTYRDDTGQWQVVSVKARKMSFDYHLKQPCPAFSRSIVPEQLVSLSRTEAIVKREVKLLDEYNRIGAQLTRLKALHEVKPVNETPPDGKES